MKIKKSDLKRAPKGAMLRCPVCRENYSASYGDYTFALSEDDVLLCECGLGLDLVVKHVVYRRAKLQPTKDT
jgi:hypothetical protein